MITWHYYSALAWLSCLPHGEGDRVPGHVADQDAVIYGHPCHGGQVELHSVADQVVIGLEESCKIQCDIQAWLILANNYQDVGRKESQTCPPQEGLNMSRTFLINEYIL